MKPFVACHHLDMCTWEVWRKSIQGKWQKWCIVYVTKNNASATHFFTLSPKPRARFRWKRARLSLFRPQPNVPTFIQIHASFRDLHVLAKTTFQIVTIISDSISVGSPIIMIISCVAVPSMVATHWVGQNSGLFFAICGPKYTDLSLPVRECP